MQAGLSIAAPDSFDDALQGAGFAAVWRGQLWSAVVLPSRAYRKRCAVGRSARPCLTSHHQNLVSAADPGGLAMYVTVMAVFLGSVALACLRDDAMDIHEAHRADDSEQLDSAG